MTPQELKNSILQRAIEGKLVEQRKEEGTGAELLEIIFEEVNSFVKLNSIRKNNKHIKTENNEDDFEIPENWGKVKLGEICFLLNGKKETNKSYPYLEVKYLRGNIEPKIKTSGKVVSANTNIILMDGENSGEVFKTSETGYLGSTLKILYIPEILSEKFYLYFLLLNKNYLRDNKKGAAIPHLDKEVFFNLNFPIPPLAEQKRIVEKIEELMPLVDKYEKNWQKLEELNKKFPEDMKKSLLQEAIKGKLVEKRPEEGNASNIIIELLNEKQKLLEEGKLYKKKPTAPFFDGNYPFDIPETWSWVQLSDVSIIQEGAGIRKYQYKVDGIQLLCVTNILENNIDLSKKQLFVSEEEYFEKYQHLTPLKGDILTACSGGSWGKVAIYNLDDTIMLNTSTLRLRFFGDLSNNKYLYYVTQSAFFKEQLKRQLVGIQPNFGYAHYSRIEFPLPPLAEQKRIVEKLDEMLPYCDELLKII